MYKSFSKRSIKSCTLHLRDRPFFVRDWRKGEKMEKEFTTISIPTSLYKKIEEKIKGSEITSVSSFITKIVRENLSKEEKIQEAFSKEDEEKVKERLKALGYID